MTEHNPRKAGKKWGLIEKCQHVTNGEELKPHPKWWQYPPEEILV
jgi:hypothetical protein